MKDRDLESSSSSAPLLYQEDESSSQSKILSTFLSAVTAAALLLLLVTLVRIQPDAGHRTPVVTFPASRGVSEGVSDKSTASLLGSSLTGYPWTKAILQWQRTGFHFQPEKNWMNDPDGPLFYKGWYHIFYQYNPDSAVWGNITWGHAVSRDLIHWLHLPLTFVPDHWYDANGVWTGSATFLPDGRIVMVYTGSTTELVQVQNLAYPADLGDPLLLNWLKSDANPVLLPPPGIGVKDFRDPTTAWYDAADAAWKLAIGSKDENHNGICLIYRTHDFIAYELLPGVLHSVPGTGMWECIDFYPVSTDSEVGLDTSVPPGPSVRHVLKASLDDDKHDYYAIGTYDLAAGQWVPDDAEADVGIGLRYDYGKYYASKTFYDTAKGRRVLWGWTGETDSEQTDLLKGWASVMAVPGYSTRRSLFEHYVRTRAEEERKEKRAAQKATLDSFKQLLEEASEDIDHKTDYQSFKRKWGSDPRFEALDRKERELLLNEKVLSLKKAFKEKVQVGVTSFKSMLRDNSDITTSSRWSKVKDSLRNDPRYKSVKHEDRELLFNEYISELKAAEEETERVAKSKRDEQEKLKERERELRKRKEREEQEMERVRVKVRRKEAVSSYQALLVETIKDPKASWTESKPKLEKDPQSRATNPDLSPSDMEKLFRDHVRDLYERCAREYLSLLSETITPEVATRSSDEGKNVLKSWSEAKHLLKSDPRYAKMPRKEREALWERHAGEVMRKQKPTTDPMEIQDSDGRNRTGSSVQDSDGRNRSRRSPRRPHGRKYG